MKNKKARGELEKSITLFFAAVIFIVFLSSGIIGEIFKAFSGFGAYSGLLSILFILMIIVSFWEALKKK